MKKLLAISLCFCALSVFAEAQLLSDIRVNFSELKFKEDGIDIKFKTRKFAIVMNNIDINFTPNMTLFLDKGETLKLNTREFHIVISPFKRKEIVLPEGYSNTYMLETGDAIQTYHYISHIRRAIVIYKKGLAESDITKLKEVLKGKDDFTLTSEPDLAIIEFPVEAFDVRDKKK